MKPWMSVQNVVLAFAAIFLVALLKLSSSELASWVQAVGSIAAIWGALKISSRQIASQNEALIKQLKTQDESKKKEIQSKAEAYYAVVECCATHSAAIVEMLKARIPIQALKIAWEAHLGLVHQTNFDALKTLPVHEFGSYDLVVSRSTILASMLHMQTQISLLIDDVGKHAVVQSARLYDEAIQYGSLIDFGWETFKDAHIKRLECL